MYKLTNKVDAIDQYRAATLAEIVEFQSKEPFMRIERRRKKMRQGGRRQLEITDFEISVTLIVGNNSCL